MASYVTSMQVIGGSDAEKAEIARKERERLRLQAKYKKDQLDKVRDQQNQDTATGEVSRLPNGNHLRVDILFEALLSESLHMIHILQLVHIDWNRRKGAGSVSSSFSSRRRCSSTLHQRPAREKKSVTNNLQLYCMCLQCCNCLPLPRLFMMAYVTVSAAAGKGGADMVLSTQRNRRMPTYSRMRWAAATMCLTDSASSPVSSSMASCASTRCRA